MATGAQKLAQARLKSAQERFGFDQPSSWHDTVRILRSCFDATPIDGRSDIVTISGQKAELCVHTAYGDFGVRTELPREALFDEQLRDRFLHFPAFMVLTRVVRAAMSINPDDAVVDSVVHDS
jgi:hypothetical protein